jgi:NADPH:quinone reductase-like Zn-dependent oxidoreductase
VNVRRGFSPVAPRRLAPHVFLRIEGANLEKRQVYHCGAARLSDSSLSHRRIDGALIATATPVIDRTYPLSETPDAIRYVGMRGARGKVVVKVA